MHAQVVTSLPELEALKLGWQRLSAMLPDALGFFGSWEYVHAYVETYAPPGWMVVAIFENKTDLTPCAVFPLLKISFDACQPPIALATTLGIQFSPYTEFNVRPDQRAASWSALFAVLHEHLHIEGMLFGPTHEESRNYLHLLESLSPETRVILKRPAYPYIDGRPGNFKAYMKGRKYSTLRDAQRCARRLAETGAVSLDLAGDNENVREIVQQLCRWNSELFADQHLHLNRSDWPDLFAILAERYLASGQVELSVLRLDGKIIAAGYSVIDKERRYYSIAAYDPAYRRYSPSKILMAWIIERTFAEHGVLCLGAGLYPYKLDWSQAVADTKLLWILPKPETREVMAPYLNWDKLIPSS